MLRARVLKETGRLPQLTYVQKLDIYLVGVVKNPDALQIKVQNRREVFGHGSESNHFQSCCSAARILRRLVMNGENM